MSSGENRIHGRNGARAAIPTAQLLDPGSASDGFHLQWDRLGVAAVEPNPFYERWFLGPAIDAFSTSPELRFFLLWEGAPQRSDLIGLLPVGPSRAFGRWPVPHVQNWMHHNCFLGAPLVREGHERAFWRALLARLDATDWPGFFHANGLVIGGPLHKALGDVCAGAARPCDLVHRAARAFLTGGVSADDHLACALSGKKRKELRRQAKRLGELGRLSVERTSGEAELPAWVDAFLALERSGWKGAQGSALASDPATAGFFARALAGAGAAGRLERLALRIDGNPIAMLANFIAAPGSFSFKTAFDERYARYSPGVLLQLENLKMAERDGVDWMDSCAAEDHPMIDSLWRDRRHIGRFSIPLSGLSRGAIFRGVRFGEELMAQVKGRVRVEERPSA